MSLTAEAAQLSVGDLLEAWSELQAIRGLLSSRSEAGLYAKVEALDNEHADLLAVLKDITFRFATVCAATGEFSEANAKALDAASVAMQKALGEA